MTMFVKKGLIKAGQGIANAQVVVNETSDGSNVGKRRLQDGKSAQNVEKKARLSCDIARPLHRRLRMAAAKNDTTIVAMIEALIEKDIDP